MNNDSVGVICAVIVMLLIFSLSLIGMMYEKNMKIDCIKSSSKQCYTVDDIYKLCGVEK